VWLPYYYGLLAHFILPALARDACDELRLGSGLVVVLMRGSG
jgi:hypothetical protein